MQFMYKSYEKSEFLYSLNLFPGNLKTHFSVWIDRRRLRAKVENKRLWVRKISYKTLAVSLSPTSSCTMQRCFTLDDRRKKLSNISDMNWVREWKLMRGKLFMNNFLLQPQISRFLRKVWRTLKFLGGFLWSFMLFSYFV